MNMSALGPIKFNYKISTHSNTCLFRVNQVRRRPQTKIPNYLLVSSQSHPELPNCIDIYNLELLSIKVSESLRNMSPKPVSTFYGRNLKSLCKTRVSP